jgi:hypothetical protein
MKNILIIFIGFCISATIVTMFRGSYYETNYFVEETKNEIEEMSIQKDSLFQFADDVLDVVINKKVVNDSIVSNLDEQVRNKEMTIEQQVYQLKNLLDEAEDAKDFALEQQELAEEMKMMSVLQKEKSEIARMESHKQYKLLLEVNKSLLEENKSLLSKIKKLKKLKTDSVAVSDTVIIDKKGIGVNKNKRIKTKKNIR